MVSSHAVSGSKRRINPSTQIFIIVDDIPLTNARYLPKDSQCDRGQHKSLDTQRQVPLGANSITI